MLFILGIWRRDLGCLEAGFAGMVQEPMTMSDRQWAPSWGAVDDGSGENMVLSLYVDAEYME